MALGVPWTPQCDNTILQAPCSIHSVPSTVSATPLPLMEKRSSTQGFFDILQPLRHLLLRQPLVTMHIGEDKKKAFKKSTIDVLLKKKAQEEESGHKNLLKPPASSFLRYLWPKKKRRHVLVSNYLLSANDESVLVKELHVSMSELDQMIQPMQHLLARDLEQGFCSRRLSDLNLGREQNGIDKTQDEASFSEQSIPSQATDEFDRVQSLCTTASKKEHIVLLPHMHVGSVCEKYGACFGEAGRGTGGIVRLVRRQGDNKVFAVKEFRRRRTDESVKHYAEALTREYCIGSILHHPNVIQTIDMIIEHERFYEVMEYCPLDLFQFIKYGQYGFVEAKSCFRQLVEGVAYLHSLGIAHRDLKPENICLGEDARLKIIDFGLAHLFKSEKDTKSRKTKGVCGSAPYIAPEEWTSQEYDPQKVDIWSCGVIFLTLVYHAFPWEASTQNDPHFSMYLRARSRGGHYRLFEGLPRDLLPLLEHMLEPDPLRRCTSTDIVLYPCFKSIVVCDITL